MFAFAKKPAGLVITAVLCLAVVALILFSGGAENKEETPSHTGPTHLVGEPSAPTETQVPPETEERNPPPTESVGLDSDAPETDVDNSTD